MHLTSLSIHGFKSFAKKAELSFTTPITAIVGPNGSGKSNVAEAFRFVLGEQSIKSLRGKRGEDLIFNGSESSARANRAAVTITLDNREQNGKRTFPLDFDEITIERVVHRDGTNEYRINGTKTRLKDVTELLAAANIGPTGHHIISQGEADRVLRATPRERREMIEDALGLKVYQYKKAESERKLKKTQENIAQVESLRREVAPHLKFLERQVKKIERSLTLQKELRAFYAAYLKREDTYIAHHHDRLHGERHEKDEVLTALKTQEEALRSKQTEGTNTSADTALHDARQKHQKIQEEKQAATRTLGQLEGQIAYLTKKIESRNANPTSKDDRPIPRQSITQALTHIEKSVDSAVKTENISLLRRTLTDILHVLKQLLHNAPTEQATPDHNEESERAALLKEKDAIEATITKLTDRESESAQACAALEQEIEVSRESLHEAERELYEILDKKRALEQEKTRIDYELGVLERDREEFKRELKEAVSLLGSGAAAYYKEVVGDTDGSELTKERIIRENRTKQHERRRELEKMKIRLEELGTGSNEDIQKEYTEVKERDAFLVHEIADLESSVTKLDTLIRELTDELNKRFEEGIDKINTEFRRLFTLMFNGGTASLTRVEEKQRKRSTADEDVRDDETVDELPEDGIDIEVKLPNKRISGLDMLSGGERALTSIALIFAVSQVNPPLFVILDETDAALDEANSRRYGDMITALAKRSQLILITHNRETMGRAGVLYGVTMSGDGISKLLSIKFDEAVSVETVDYPTSS